MRRIYAVLGAAIAVAAVTAVIGVTSGTAVPAVTYHEPARVNPGAGP